MTTAALSYTVLRAERRDVDLQALLADGPSLAHGPTRVPLGTVVVDPDDNDRVLLAYLPYEAACDRALRTLLEPLKVPPQSRTAGVVARSLTFGSLPRLELRGRDWCTGAAFNNDHPALFELLAEQAAPLEALYEQLVPEVFTHHADRAATVLADWRLPHSKAFTGGVVNRDSAIGYHHDTGNFSDVWSAMICLRRGRTGGELVMPELGLYLPVEDKSVAYFDGQGVLHGVTPIRNTSRKGFRYTVVYYSTKRLWACLPPTAEVARGATKRTERAMRRAGQIQ